MVDLVAPWTACPRCGSERYHLFGERATVRTGEVVKSLMVASPIEAGVVREDAPPDYDLVTTAVVDRELLSDRIGRECRSCGHEWNEEIMRSVAPWMT